MGDFVSEFGGGLITIPLKDFMCIGCGDDFLIRPKNLPGRRSYGTLTIINNYDSCINDDYARAVTALGGHNDDIMLACVEDPESASPYLFVRDITRNDKKYRFPVIFNASLWSYAEDGKFFGFGEVSFNLRLGDEIDPERKCAVRIMYTPGKRIEWCEDDVNLLFSRL